MTRTGSPARLTARRLAVLAIAGVIALLLTASSTPAISAGVATLGTPPPEAESSPAPAEDLDEQDAMVAFAGCMRDEGIDWPDPASDGSKFAGTDGEIDKESPEVVAAFDVCSDELSLGAAGASTS